MQEIEKCTRCGKKINDIKVFIDMHIHVKREKSTKEWEDIANSDNITHEIVCKECFDKFVQVLGEAMN